MIEFLKLIIMFLKLISSLLFLSLIKSDISILNVLTVCCITELIGLIAMPKTLEKAETSIELVIKHFFPLCVFWIIFLIFAYFLQITQLTMTSYLMKYMNTAPFLTFIGCLFVLMAFIWDKY